ncbi:MAG TPA: hypothetical protein DCS93_34115 [Microscillaceae bacterium]|nr:hypothetical protein [Microscillaceae bacterium]
MDNKKLHKLLVKSPKEFIVHKSIGEVIEKTVYKFVSKGGIYGQTTEDIISEVTLIILEKKLDYIAKSYNPQFSTIRGYMSKVVFNLCIELLRKQKNKPVFKNSLDDIQETTLEQGYSNINPEANFIAQETIESELNKLRNYLRIFAKYKAKFVLLIKLYCRIPLKDEDFQHYATNLSSDEWMFYYQTFSKDYSNYSDKEIYQLIIPLVNKVENKQNTPDALRKWINAKVLTLKEAMSQNTHYQYDTESFKNLVRLL